PGKVLAQAKRSKTVRRRAHGNGDVRSDAVIEQHRHETGKARLVLGIGNGDQFLMFPYPPGHRIVHGERVELSTFLVPLPVVSQHAIPARVMEGVVQQFARRQGQHRGGEFFERVGQTLGSHYRSVISSSPRYRLRSGEGSSSSTTLVSDIDTPPAPAACNKSGNLS